MGKWTKKALLKRGSIMSQKLYEKNVQHLQVLREMEIKLLWDSISLQSEWQSSRQITINAGKDMGEKKLLYTLGRNVNEYNHYRN